MSACPTGFAPSSSHIDEEVVLRCDGLWVAPHDLANALCVRCLCGHVWLTQEGRAEDIVIAPGGMCLVPAGHGKVVVQALEDAVVRVEH